MGEPATSAQEAGRALGFTEVWWELGVVSAEQVERLAREYCEGDDPHTEHYRYHAFREYLSAARPLSPGQAEGLFELGAGDPDRSMGAAMRYDVISLAECPESLRDRALASGERSLVKLVTRIRQFGEAGAR